ncbi:MAG: hypothetical protein ACFCUQ_02605 [Kiloniellales bacterium]
MHSKPRIMTAARTVTVAGDTGGALAVGVAAYQPPLAADLTTDLAARLPVAGAIPVARAPHGSAARLVRSDAPG